MPVVVCVVCKLRPCLSYSRRRDRNNSILLCGLDKGGWVRGKLMPCTPHAGSLVLSVVPCLFVVLRVVSAGHSEMDLGGNSLGQGTRDIYTACKKHHAHGHETLAHGQQNAAHASRPPQPPHGG